MKKKIAIITDMGFQKKEYDRFSVGELSKKFEIFIFDFTKITNPLLNKIVKKNKIKLKKFYEVNNYKAFEKVFLNNKFLTTIPNVSNYELILKINNFLKNNSLSSTSIQNHISMVAKKNFFQKIYNFIFVLLDKKRILRAIESELSLLGLVKSKNCPPQTITFVPKTPPVALLTLTGR